MRAGLHTVKRVQFLGCMPCGLSLLPWAAHLCPDPCPASQAAACSPIPPRPTQLYKDLRAGQLKKPFDEFRFCIEHGFADRTFAPLVPAAASAAGQAAAVPAAPEAAASVAAQAVEVQAS